MGAPTETSKGRKGIPPWFLRRLAVYLLGVAIGLMILGLIQQARQASIQRRQQQEAAASGGSAPDQGGKAAAPASGSPGTGEVTDPDGADG